MDFFRICIFFVIFFLTACSPTVSSPTEVISHLSQYESYPVSTPTISMDTYPQPSNENNFLPAQIDVPTPEMDNGVIIGKILVQGTNEPYLNSILILGEISEANQPGYPPLVGFSVENSPHALQAEDGSFVFTSVKPGNYAIVLWSPLSTFLLSNFQTGETIFITVNPGEITDLGTVYVK